MKHILTALVRNHPGVLARIVGVIAGRGFNIESLNVAPTQDSRFSRLTLSVPGDARVLEQVSKQLNRMQDVVKVTNLTGKRFVNRELLLVEVETTPNRRSELVELANLFGARVVLVRRQSMTVQLAGDEDKIEGFLALLNPRRVVDVSRTGIIAVGRVESDRRKVVAV